MVVRIGQNAGAPKPVYFREWRRHKNLTQQQVADRLKASKGAVSKMELGDVKYNQSSLEAWAYALGCEPYELFFNPNTPRETDVIKLFREASPEIQRAVEAVLKTGTNS